MPPKIYLLDIEDARFFHKEYPNNRAIVLYLNPPEIYKNLEDIANEHSGSNVVLIGRDPYDINEITKTILKDHRCNVIEIESLDPKQVSEEIEQYHVSAIIIDAEMEKEIELVNALNEFKAAQPSRHGESRSRVL